MLVFHYLIFILIGSTTLFSCMGWEYTAFTNDFLGYPYQEWYNGEWYRLLTQGFLHEDFYHLFFNMFSLYYFGMRAWEGFQKKFRGDGRSSLAFFGLYFGGIVAGGFAGSLLYHGNALYKSLGASAGVSAVVALSAIMEPYREMCFWCGGLPAWLSMVLFFCVSFFYSYYDDCDNIAHVAHLGGALYGVGYAVFFFWREVRAAWQKRPDRGWERWN